MAYGLKQAEIPASHRLTDVGQCEFKRRQVVQHVKLQYRMGHTGVYLLADQHQ